MNKAWISGNIVADAELKTVNVGGVPTPRCRFAVAVNEKKKNGEKIVNFFEVTLWRDQTVLAPWLMKGRRVNVEGNIRLNKFMTSNNEPRFELQIANPTVELCDKKPAAEPTNGAPVQAEDVVVVNDPEVLPF